MRNLRTKIEEAIKEEQKHQEALEGAYFGMEELQENIITIFKEELGKVKYRTDLKYRRRTHEHIKEARKGIISDLVQKIKPMGISPVSVREYELIEAVKKMIIDSLINSLNEGKGQ